MPLFGSRIVVGTANVKHIKEFNEGIAQREESLAQWEKEKQKRKEQLEILQKEIQDRSRRNSLVSQKSQDQAQAVQEETDANEFTDIPQQVNDDDNLEEVNPAQELQDENEEKNLSNCGKCSIQ